MTTNKINTAKFEFAPLSDLVRVEALISSTFSSDSSLMQQVPEYLLSLGGKRIRPTLTLLCAQALGAKTPSDEVVQVAAGIELIHMATLLHDDIIDNSSLRRHKPSPLAVFGIPATILSGDFLLVRAFGLCAMLDKEIIKATETACIELVEGESLETPLFQAQHSLDYSLTIARKKTASLFRLGAYSAGFITSDRNTLIAAQLAEFGEQLGIAFQILDDVLDVASDRETLGKEPGTDIRERKPSVVNVLWLETGSEKAKRLLVEPDNSKSNKNEETYVQGALKEINSSGVLKQARELALKHAERSEIALLSAIELAGADKNNQPLVELQRLIKFTLDRMA